MPSLIMPYLLMASNGLIFNASPTGYQFAITPAARIAASVLNTATGDIAVWVV